MTMGHNTQTWTRFYDKHFQRRECQAGIDVMHQWRAQLLTEEHATLRLSGCVSDEEESVESETDASETDDDEDPDLILE